MHAIFNLLIIMMYVSGELVLGMVVYKTVVSEAGNKWTELFLIVH